LEDTRSWLLALIYVVRPRYWADGAGAEALQPGLCIGAATTEMVGQLAAAVLDFVGNRATGQEGVAPCHFVGTNPFVKGTRES
jgi:hypothetical protein